MQSESHVARVPESSHARARAVAMHHALCCPRARAPQPYQAGSAHAGEFEAARTYHGRISWMIRAGLHGQLVRDDGCPCNCARDKGGKGRQSARVACAPCEREART